MKKSYLVGIAAVALILSMAIATVLLSRSNTGSPDKVDDGLVMVAGQVTEISHPPGDCLSYQLDEMTNVVAKCPDMDGQRGFVGNYDKSIAVGDKVTVRGNLKLKDSTHQTYHLSKPGTYMERVKHSDSQGNCLALECGDSPQSY